MSIVDRKKVKFVVFAKRRENAPQRKRKADVVLTVEKEKTARIRPKKRPKKGI